jgi:RNA polymerase sigma-70 factor (ECF subfamily)
MTVTDSELIARVRRGELDAYTELVSRHRLSLERYAHHLLGCREDAEDALQETLLRAYRAIGQCQQPERFRAWVLRILINRCRTRLSRRDPFVSEAVAGDAIARLSSLDTSDGTAWREEIQRALGSIAPDQREAFLLKHVEELSYDEIAAITGATVSALKMRVSRACEHLRELLQDVYHAR